MRQRTYSLLFIEMKPSFLFIVPTSVVVPTLKKKMYLVSRAETFAKLFFLICFTGLLMYIVLAFYSFHTAYSNLSQVSGYQDRYRGVGNLPAKRYIRDLKYILVWTMNNDTEFEKEGQTLFIQNDCSDLNCYITKNKTILYGNYTNFDAIVFNFTASTRWQNFRLPKSRLQHQKYIFHTKLPSEDHPICNIVVNNYFNWTWTYKFGSDIFSPFIEVKDLQGNVVAPSSNVIWKTNVEHTKNDFSNDITQTTKLLKKTLVWIMNSCDPRIIRKIANYVKTLKKSLEEHSLDFDIYGCQHTKCFGATCSEIIAIDYYFYFVYDGSMTKDYVTDEVVKAYDHGVVPIVFGGADYTKFLPDGSYINAQDVPAEKLASLIAYTLRSTSRYNEYFQWKKLYTVHKIDDNKSFCTLCSLLNNKKTLESYSSYRNFREWWFQGSLRDRCLPKGAERYSEIMSYLNASGN